MNHKITTLHPDPNKKGVNIDKTKYHLMKQTIIKILKTHQPITFMKFLPYIEKELAGKFSGSIGWYYTSVKLDLETRGIIVHHRDNNPPIISLSSHNK